MKLAIERWHDVAGRVRPLRGRPGEFHDLHAEPARASRQQMGLWVLALLTLGFFISLWLKHEYWKDVK